MSVLFVDDIRGKTAGTDRYVTQVKQFSLTTAESITSTSFVDSSVTVNITPSSTSRKIEESIDLFRINTTFSGNCIIQK